MVVVSVPMMAIVIGYLPYPRYFPPGLAAAGAGVACMALTLLAHPTHVSALDFLMHLSATATIILGTMLLGYKWVSLPHH
jgi:hypothetical protein